MIKSKILVVEDSVFFASVMKQRLEAELDVEVIFATTKKEAVEVIAQHKDDIFLSILDLTLPDAGGIEIVDTVTEFKVPIIVFTGTYSEDLRESILSRDVVDYVVKDNPSSLYYLVALVKRLFQNQNLTALIVDDSSTSRRYLCDLLKRYQFKTVEAADGIEALEVLDKNSSGKSVV